VVFEQGEEMMKLRIVMGVAALGLLAACSDSDGGADKAQAAPSRTEETVAAELLHGLLDRITDDRYWIEQTSASPASFTIHQDNNESGTITVTKLGQCKYDSKIETTGAKPFTAEATADLNGVNPDDLPNNAGLAVRVFPGAVLTCKMTSGGDSADMPAFCRSATPSGTLKLAGIQLARLKQLTKEFKQAYCQ
jgi:hypothetical protein